MRYIVYILQFCFSGIFPGPVTLRPAGAPTHLSEELLQEGSGPAVVKVPAFGRVADVGRVQQQGQGFGFVNAAEESDGEN